MKTEADETGRGAAAEAFLRRKFPAVLAYFPAATAPFSRGFGAGDGCSTHPALVQTGWMTRRGGGAFEAARASIPEGFFAAGVKNAGGSEYVFAMWKRGGRLFWFQQQYVNFHVGEAYEAVRASLAAALEQWDAGRGDVL